MILKSGSKTLRAFDCSIFSECIEIRGYLSRHNALNVSVHITNEICSLVIESISEKEDIIKNYSYPITLREAKDLLELTIPGTNKQYQHLCRRQGVEGENLHFVGDYEKHMFASHHDANVYGSSSNQEIERKFLVMNGLDLSSYPSSEIYQGYINSDPVRTIRIRTRDDNAYLTIKGIGNESGASRYEFETSIPFDDAVSLIPHCEPGAIQKTRYIIPAGIHFFEVDVFSKENMGLILAEIELTSEDEPFESPTWLSMEVTGDKKYYNSLLALHPYTMWALSHSLNKHEKNLEFKNVAQCSS